MEDRFKIDFFEFSFLVESCIPPVPIARSCFWDKCIDYYYQILTDEERKNLHEWLNRNDKYKRSLFDRNEDVLIFEARFNPDNQYIITTNYNNKIETNEYFKYKDRYYKGKNISIIEDYIVDIKKKF